MHHRIAIGAIMLVTVLGMTTSNARAFDESRYPGWKGQWLRTDTGIPRYDPGKPAGRGQQAPLTPEYQAVLEASLADQAAGGQGNDPTYTCIAPGMPRIMNNYEGAEFVITPGTTYISTGTDLRRIFTDGRPWPTDLEPTYQGYTIGRWIDQDGDGVYATLEAETRGPFKGPRAYDATGLPLHFDNESTFKEKFFIDKAGLLHDIITVFDHALTRPWTVDKTFRRNPNPYPNWSRTACTETTQHIVVGKEAYMLSADGMLMPAKKDQPPPDLRYFKQTQK